MGRKLIPLETKFWRDVCPEPNTGCWIWTGYISAWTGYGEFRMRNKSVLAHRASWQIHHGQIQESLFVCHTCDNRWCVNPAHLFLGTIQDNHADMCRKGRVARGDRHGSRTCPERVRRGSKNGRALLTEEAVATIRRMSAEGRPQREMMELFGVSQSLISLVALRKVWRHVP
jgi:hypothetical protein